MKTGKTDMSIKDVWYPWRLLVTMEASGIHGDMKMEWWDNLIYVCLLFTMIDLYS